MLWSALAALPHAPSLGPQAPECRVYDPFTDGTCLLPTIPQLRLAGWGVTLARPTLHALVLWFLQGSFQGLFRPEIYAFLAAAHFAVGARAPVRVWTDCQGVLQRAIGLLEGTWFPKPGSANSDLWRRVQLELGDRVAPLTVHKVVSHVSADDATDVVDAWAFLSNEDVDQVARAANRQRAPAFVELWEDVRKDYSLQEMIGRATLRVHAMVASSAVRLSKGQELASPESYLAKAEEEVRFPARPDRHQPKLWSRYGRPYIEALYSWMDATFAGDQVAEEPLRWISVVHLLFSFHQFSGLLPPWFDHRTKRWTTVGQFTRPELARLQVGVLSAAFCRHLRECTVA